MNTITKQTLENIKAQVSDVKEADIINLVGRVQQLYKKKREGLTNTDISLDQWVPSTKAVKEILSLRIRIIDINKCLSDFNTYANSKGWTHGDNLDAKLITHIKIMIQQSKVSTIPLNEYQRY